MLCEKCLKRNATTHIKTVINGKIIEKHLCGDCAVSEGIISFHSNPLNQMLTSIFENSGAAGLNAAKRCECCGASFSDIRESGKVGCSKCYETFYDELLPYIKRIHGSTVHNGKRIEKSTEDTKENIIKSLKEQLQKLIKEENFEQAAVIRDKIRQAEGNL